MRFFSWIPILALTLAMAPARAERAAVPALNSAAAAIPADTPPYDAVGRRDPFRPFMLDLQRPEEPVQAELTPLQRYDLGQLTVVGTIWALKPPRAMIEDSAGMGYIVTIGTAIGRSGGIVTGIEDQRVIVEERVTDFYGNEQTNRVVMEIPKEEGSSSSARGQR
jgi:Tfp pilus assembly protein PilP